MATFIHKDADLIKDKRCSQKLDGREFNLRIITIRNEDAHGGTDANYQSFFKLTDDTTPDPETTSAQETTAAQETTTAQETTLAQETTSAQDTPSNNIGIIVGASIGSLILIVIIYIYRKKIGSFF
jgi:hypothetical protein